MLAFTFTTSTALAIGALCTGVAAIVTAYAAVVKARGEASRKGAEDCEQHLAQARAEAENYAQQLHTERIARQLEDPDA